MKQIKNLENFQGEKHLQANKNYFEGWYYKNVNSEHGIAFIPGVHIHDNERKAFIQIITNQQSYFINYEIHDFIFHSHPFAIQIQNSLFTKEGIIIDIEDKVQNLKVQGILHYSDSHNIQTNLFQPNIMGPFSYVPFMECNHAILCMRNSISGSIHLNDDIYNFNHGIGYIEKDWGCSFPKSYVWCQGNNFAHSDASFLLSIADIPFMSMNFKGLICVLIIGQKEYRFASYNRSRITKYEITEKGINIQLQRKSYTLSITSYYEVGHVLSAPVEGKMDKNIYESISASINVTLKENSTILFSDTSTCCGLEIV